MLCQFSYNYLYLFCHVYLLQEELVKKLSLPDKFSDFSLAAHKVNIALHEFHQTVACSVWGT